MSSREEHAAVRSRVGHWLLPDVGVLRVTGEDRLSWTSGMVTNDIHAVPDGGSMPAAVVTAKGKLIALVDVWRDPDAILFLVEAGRLLAVQRVFDGFIIMEDVCLTDESAELCIVTLQGPAAAVTVAGIDAPMRTKDRSGAGGVDLLVQRGREREVTAALAARGATPVGEEAVEWLRVEAGIRRWGREATEDMFPQEARLEGTHVSFSKGCYVGQETVVRLRDRGHANRLVAGLDLGDAAPPAPGAIVFAGGQEVGAVTSAVASPTLRRTVAMAIVRRDQTEIGTALRVGDAEARVMSLPFVDRAAGRADG